MLWPPTLPARCAATAPAALPESVKRDAAGAVATSKGPSRDELSKCPVPTCESHCPSKGGRVTFRTVVARADEHEEDDTAALLSTRVGGRAAAANKAVTGVAEAMMVGAEARRGGEEECDSDRTLPGDASGNGCSCCLKARCCCCCGVVGLEVGD